MKEKLALLTAAAMLLPGFFSHADFQMTRRGKPVCSILVRDNASAPEKHAAAELSRYLGKISGGENPAITGKTGKNQISFALSADQEIAAEGFRIVADDSSLTIQAKQPIGFLYGAYEILKRYCGIRWIVPGADGEYFTVKPSLSVPRGTTLSNPSFSFRNIHWGAASIRSPKWDSFDWMIRNNLRIYEIHVTFLAPELRPGLEARCAEIQDGGHCFSDLLGAWDLPPKDTYAKYQARLRRMFQEHPEYFPVINGRRVFLEGHKYQPCTSNPEVVRIMSENLIANLDKYCSLTPGGRYRLVNNDGTGWCQCENCRKIDKGDPGMTTRYWSFINELGRRAWEKRPRAMLNTIAYQNYEKAPESVVPDSRFATVELSFNRICYRHRLDDPDCPTNRRYLRQYREWEALAKKRNLNLVAYAQIDALGARFMPIEDTYIHDLKLYHRMGIMGLRPQIPPVDGRYSARYRDTPMVKNTWYGMWQTLYLYALHAWDIHADTEAVYEEVNALYYGKKAWEGGMREFRRLLSKTFRETPGCFGHGHSSPLGRCLDAPGVHGKLKACLDAAEKAAAGDPDPRALMHVRREKEIFRITWEKFRADYLANYREFRSYRRQHPIVIDGVLDERDWKNADTVSRFKLTGKPVPAEHQTYVKIVHEPEYLYFGIEAEEPFPEKMTTNVRTKDGPVWEDNTVEIFLTHPDLGKSYYQIIINADGVVFDQFVQPGSKGNAAADTGIVVRTKRGRGNWTVEARIPTANLGEKCFDGQSWRINVLRARKIDGIVMHSGVPVESSTLSIGNPHDTDTFQVLHFCRERAVSVSGRELDTRPWKNGSFEETAEKKVPPVRGGWTVRDGVMPASWSVAGRAGFLALKRDEKRGNVVALSGNLANEYAGREKNVKITMSARGRGVCGLWWYCYDVVNGKRKHKLSRQITEFRIDTGDVWRTFTFTAEVPQEDHVKFALHSCPEKGAELEYDSVHLTPSGEKRASR